MDISDSQHCSSPPIRSVQQLRQAQPRNRRTCPVRGARSDRSSGLSDGWNHRMRAQHSRATCSRRTNQPASQSPARHASAATDCGVPPPSSTPLNQRRARPTPDQPIGPARRASPTLASAGCCSAIGRVYRRRARLRVASREARVGYRGYRECLHTCVPTCSMWGQSSYARGVAGVWVSCLLCTVANGTHKMVRDNCPKSHPILPSAGHRWIHILVNRCVATLRHHTALLFQHC